MKKYNTEFKSKKEFMRFLKDGMLEVSNNHDEQEIRPITIGRKNYLFSTSMNGAIDNANQLNTFNYLNYLFE